MNDKLHLVVFFSRILAAVTAANEYSGCHLDENCTNDLPGATMMQFRMKDEHEPFSSSWFSGATASPPQPSGVTNPLYKCTSKEGDAMSLVILLNDVPVGCGNTTAFEAGAVTTPWIALHGASPDMLYAALLLNPDNIIPAFINPIMHHAVFNINGSDFAAGRLGNASTLLKFFPPNPPIPYWTFHYIYLVFEQIGKVSFTEPLQKRAFPVEAVMTQNNMTLVKSNYFTSRWTLFSDSVAPSKL